MGIDKDLLRQHDYMEPWSILLGYRGSISHGMFVPSSDPNSIDDKDVLGIVVPPLEYYCGLSEFGSRGTREIKQGVWDIVLYELRKAIRLLSQGNPNILSLLWLHETHYLKVTPAGQYILDNRSIFAGKHVYNSYVGYAKGQLHRMTHSACQGYMGAKRKTLVEKFGYDTKNAAHLVRIMRMGIEFLSTGELQVLRPDAQELLEIKRGEWTLDRVHEKADQLFARAEEALIRSPLPMDVDREKINKLCVTVYELAREGN